MFDNESEINEELYRGPAIDAPYQVLLHLAEWFQRRRLKCEKLTDDGRKSVFVIRVKLISNLANTFCDFSPVSRVYLSRFDLI
jgi:hypothetical protein